MEKSGPELYCDGTRSLLRMVNLHVVDDLIKSVNRGDSNQLRDSVWVEHFPDLYFTAKSFCKTF